MSFSFSFSGDDIEHDEDDMQDASSGPTTMVATQGQSHDLTPPQLHTLAELLRELPSQITYNNLSIPSQLQPLTIGRRSLFDIRTQLMAESSSTNDNDALIANLSSGDLSIGAYEGGFKTWECAIDLASLLTNDSSFIQSISSTPTHIIELGAGSAIPSLAVLRQTLHRNINERSSQQPLAFTLADYNADVLKLCTAPNVLLNTYLLLAARDAHTDISDQAESDNDFDLDLEAIQPEIHNLPSTLSHQNISINLISGAWGQPFVDSLSKTLNPTAGKPKILILASETIYSPATLPIFTSTLLSILELGGHGSKALVAAKQIYFGVGGGVAEFEREVGRQHGDAVVRVVWASEGGNAVGRVVLEVVLGSG